MRPIKTRPRFHCDFCSYTSSSVPGMERHEKVCWANPNRFCDLCKNKGHLYEDYAATPCPYCSRYDAARWGME